MTESKNYVFSICTDVEFEPYHIMVGQYRLATLDPDASLDSIELNLDVNVYIEQDEAGISYTIEEVLFKGCDILRLLTAESVEALTDLMPRSYQLYHIDLAEQGRCLGGNDD